MKPSDFFWLICFGRYEFTKYEFDHIIRSNIKNKKQAKRLLYQVVAFERFKLKKSIPTKLKFGSDEYQKFVFENFGKWFWFRAYVKHLFTGKHSKSY